MIISTNTAKAHMIEPSWLLDEDKDITIDLCYPYIAVDTELNDVVLYCHFSVEHESINVLTVPVFIFSKSQENLIYTVDNGIHTTGVCMENDRIVFRRETYREDTVKVYSFPIPNLVFANKYLFGYHWKDVLKLPKPKSRD